MFARIFVFLFLSAAAVFSEMKIFPLHPDDTSRFNFAAVRYYPATFPYFDSDGRLLVGNYESKLFSGLNPVLKEKQVFAAVWGWKQSPRLLYRFPPAKGMNFQKVEIAISASMKDDYVDAVFERNSVFPTEAPIALLGTLFAVLLNFLIRRRYQNGKTCNFYLAVFCLSAFLGPQLFYFLLNTEQLTFLSYWGLFDNPWLMLLSLFISEIVVYLALFMAIMALTIPFTLRHICSSRRQEMVSAVVWDKNIISILAIITIIALNAAVVYFYQSALIAGLFGANCGLGVLAIIGDNVKALKAARAAEVSAPQT